MLTFLVLAGLFVNWKHNDVDMYGISDCVAYFMDVTSKYVISKKYKLKPYEN